MYDVGSALYGRHSMFINVCSHMTIDWQCIIAATEDRLLLCCWMKMHTLTRAASFSQHHTSVLQVHNVYQKYSVFITIVFMI